MPINEAARAADSIALVARALRSLDIAGVLLPPAASSRRPAKATHRSLRGALRALLDAEHAPTSGRRLDLVLARVREAMIEGIALFGADGEIAYADKNLCRMLGRRRRELIDKPAAQHFGEIFAKARSAGARAPGYETELRTKAGGALVVQVSSERIEAADGTLLGVFAVMIDITARATALRRCESEVRLLSAQFMAAQELERQHIARELHDSVGQALGGVKFTLETCQAQIAAGAGEAAARTLRQLAGRIGGVVEEVHRVSTRLRPSSLDDLGILPTLAGYSREFRAIYPQLELETLVDISEAEIAAPVKTAIYRIVQEAINNIVVHSGARQLSLALRRRGRDVELQVQDDGVGFDPAGCVAPGARCGLGLSTMRERAEITGGRFALRSEKGRGTVLAVTWPGYNPVART